MRPDLKRPFFVKGGVQSKMTVGRPEVSAALKGDRQPGVAELVTRRRANLASRRLHVLGIVLEDRKDGTVGWRRG